MQKNKHAVALGKRGGMVKSEAKARSSRENGKLSGKVYTEQLVFWVAPNGEVLDAGKAHRESPPNGDRSIFVDPSHQGHLRGRAAFIGEVIYIVVYGKLTKTLLALLRRSYPKILAKIKEKHPKLDSQVIGGAQFIDEEGNTLSI